MWREERAGERVKMKEHPGVDIRLLENERTFRKSSTFTLY